MLTPKVLCLLIILVTSVFSVVSVFPASSWHTPCSTDDGLYEEFGPRPSQLLIKIYSDYTAELNAFKNKEIDIMDWALEPIDYQWFQTNDPAHEQYSTAFYNEFGMFQYDINNQVLPTSYASVRQAFAHMLDKQYFIDTHLAGMGKKMDSVLDHLPGWYNPACTDMYNLQPRTTMTPLPDDSQDWEAAYDLLVADLGPPVPDPEYPGYYTWIWPSPFPTPDPTGQLPPVADGHLLVFHRYEGPRHLMGDYFKDCVEAMPAMLQTLGKPPARLHVDLYMSPYPLATEQVMRYYRYHIYTGGWYLSRDPDFLVFYTSSEIIKPEPYGNNYVMYANPNFDAEVDLMLDASAVGSATNPCDALYHAYLAQDIMENDEPIVPMCTTAGYKTYQSNWRGMVNEAGIGINSWWTFMNAHKAGSEGGDVIRYGWAGDLLSLNVFEPSGGWYWDEQVLGKVYDTLIKFNPYDLTEDRPWMANWEIGTWDNEGQPCTSVTFHLRQDMWWQDVPYKDRTVGDGHLDASFSNYQVTPVDVAFSIEYQRDNPNAWKQWMLDPIDHVGLNLECWGDAWPWTNSSGPLPPWWNLTPEDWQYDFVQNNGTLDAYDITVYFRYAWPPLITLHWLGDFYIVPMHVWQWIGIYGSENVDTWAEDLVYGSGPWILFDRQPGVSMSMIPFRNGQSYRGITLEKSGWMCYPVRPESPPAQFDIGVGVTGKKIVAGTHVHFVCYDRMYGHDIEGYFELSGTATVEGTDYPLPAMVAFASPELSFGQTYGAFAGVTIVLAPPLDAWNGVVTATVTLTVTLHWHIASCAHDPLTCNFISLWGHTCPIESIYDPALHVHPPDIAGAATVHYPYLGSDGICSIKDATLIGLYWLQVVPPDTDPTYDLARADINGDNQVTIKDATLIGLYWMQTWC